MECIHVIIINFYDTWTEVDEGYNIGTGLVSYVSIWCLDDD